MGCNVSPVPPFCHRYDYYGGPEFGWVYTCHNGNLAHYFCGNCNIKPGQRWRSKGTQLGTTFMGRQIGLRLEFGTDASGTRTMRSQVYDVKRTHVDDFMYELTETWPDWIEDDPRYDSSKPW